MGKKQVWDSLSSVIIGGMTEINLNDIKIGIPQTTMWRGKPVFILQKIPQMEPSPRDATINNNHYTILIGLCTHLGCIPAWKTNKWKCACHGGEFDYNGKNIFGPPPRSLDLVPFNVKENTLVLGEEGTEYKKIVLVEI